MRYTIINSLDLEKVDLKELSSDPSFNIDRSQCILVFKGETPHSLRKIKPVEYGNRYYHSHKEMIALKKIVSANPSLGWVLSQED